MAPSLFAHPTVRIEKSAHLDGQISWNFMTHPLFIKFSASATEVNRISPVCLSSLMNKLFDVLSWKIKGKTFDSSRAPASVVTSQHEGSKIMASMLRCLITLSTT